MPTAPIRAKTPSSSDQPARIRDRGFRLVRVVERPKRQRAPVHAAAPVRFLERRLDTEPQVLAQVLRGTAESRRLSEENLLVGHPWLFCLYRYGTRKREPDGHEEGRRPSHPRVEAGEEPKTYPHGSQQ